MSSIRVLGGRYRLLGRLDGGGRAVVWRGYDQVLDRPVAVTLLAGDVTDAAGRELARVEARTAAQLSHPHICEVYDYAEFETEPGDRVAYLVTELLTGPTLEERLRTGPMPVPVALRTCAQVASALAAAHGSGLVHRCITPARVVLTRAGAKLVDFGVAATACAPDQPAPDEEMGSTPACLAPERLRHGKARPASDVYALGLLVYRAVSGAAPWPAETVTEILKSYRYREPAPLPPVEGLPDIVAELCQRCLATDPQERPTAHEAARRLAEAGGWQVPRAGKELLEVDDDPPGPAPEPATVAVRPVPPPAVSAGPATAPAPPTAAVAAVPAPGRPPLPSAPGGEADGPAPRQEVKRHQLRQHRRRRWPVLLAAAAVAVVLVGVTGAIWLAGSSTDRYGSGAAAPDDPSPGPPATHPSGAGSSLPSAGPAGPTDTRAGGGEPRDASGDARSGDAGTGYHPPASPDIAPPEPAPGTPEVATNPQAGPAQDLVETPAGTIFARCAGSAASVEPLDLAPGYRVIAHTRGPGVVRAGIVLGSSENHVRVDVLCRAGEPVSAVKIA